MPKHDNVLYTATISSIDATELAAITGGNQPEEGWTCYRFFGFEICVKDGAFAP